ncbi:hypothetical protein E2C01_067344 [Portunus trituberculatus]|uniref:Uncharacterized protein n=1 Tax=Portunus trituberculatus TaxID=210409 RepID=A0A5B7HWG4_PORTR|nr:hypothetical protein [Portunus trituberculatus]
MHRGKLHLSLPQSHTCPPPLTCHLLLTCFTEGLDGKVKLRTVVVMLATTTTTTITTTTTTEE